MSKKTRANLMLLIIAFIWGIAFVAQISGSKEIGAFTFNFSRNIVAAFSLLILIQIWPYIMKKPMEKETDKVKKSTMVGGVVCGIVLTVAMTFQQLGLSGGNTITVARAGFITALYIVLVLERQPFFRQIHSEQKSIF